MRTPTFCLALCAVLACAAAADASPLARVRTVRGALGVVAPGALGSPTAIEAAARAVLAARPEASGARFGEARVSTTSDGRRVVALPQVHDGVPVALRGARVAFGPDGVARLASIAVEDDLPASTTPVLGAAQAIAVAAASSGVEGAATLAVWPSPEGARLAWVVYAPAQGLPWAPLVVVDAIDGGIVIRWNAATASDLANVYASNPTKSPQLVEVTLPVGPSETTLQNGLVQSLDCIDKKSVKTVFNIKVHTCDLLQTAVPDANGDYLLPAAADTEPEDAFSEVQMFHHANRAYAFFRGFDPALDLNGGVPLPTVSNLRLPAGYEQQDLAKMADPNLPLVPFQNAFFAPSNPIFSQVFGINGGAMWFGQGPKRDYSYDGDVVYHELTHAVVNVTAQLIGGPHLDEYGVSMSPGAMNEGIADYFSSAITGDPDVGEYAAQDFAPNLVAIRTLANSDACPATIGGEVHQDSTLFSGALWEVRATLQPAEQAELDAAVFGALQAAPTGDLGYEDLAKLIATSVAASPLGQPVADALDAVMTARGVLPQCTRLLEATGAPLKGPKDFYGMWVAPGTSTTGVKTLGWTPGVVQVHQALAADAGTLTVEITSVPFSGGGGLGQTGTPFAPKVLVRFGADPITFGYKPFSAPTDLLVVDPTKTGSKYAATVDVPPGATDVHVMIGSSGELDGAYTSLAITTAPLSTSAGVGGGGGAGGAGAGGEPPHSQPKEVEAGGCGCSLPGHDAPAFPAALAIALALAARRRRASRRT